MSNFIKITLAIVTLITFSSMAHAGKKNARCVRKMEAAKNTAYDIGYNYYMSTYDMAAAKKKGISHIRRVCRNYCRGIKPRFGGRKITCRERINNDSQLDAILSRVSFEADLDEDKAEQEIGI